MDAFRGRELPDAQLRPLQVAEDGDRVVVLGLDLPDSLEEFELQKK